MIEFFPLFLYVHLLSLYNGMNCCSVDKHNFLFSSNKITQKKRQTVSNGEKYNLASKAFTKPANSSLVFHMT